MAVLSKSPDPSAPFAAPAEKLWEYLGFMLSEQSRDDEMYVCVYVYLYIVILE